MKRKAFMKAAGGFVLPAGLVGHGNRAFANGVDRPVFREGLDNLGGRRLADLRELHLNYLLETYIPNLERGVDWEYGGFANATIPGAEPDFSRKSMYFQGRAIWVFSTIYNHFTGDPKHLEAARNGRDFVVRHALRENYSWISHMNRSGRAQSDPLDHYGDIYMVLGLVELYRATGDEEDLRLAMRSAHSVMDRLVSPFYQHVDAHITALEPGTRRLPSWQHFLNALTPLLNVRRDPAIEKVALYCVRVICEHHWSPELRILYENLDDQFRPYTFDVSYWGEGHALHGVVSGWHAIQACWAVMDEAHRVGNRPVYRKGFEMGLATLEKCYLEGRGLASLDSPTSSIDPNGPFPWGALDDLLLFCLIAIEHSHDPQAIGYYNRTFDLYMTRPDRFQPEGLLHQPRRYFRTIEILDRIIKRNGSVSGFLG